MADRQPSSKREEAKRLRKERLKAFVDKPARDDNILIDLPSNTITTQERTQNMTEKIDQILKPFHQ